MHLIKRYIPATMLFFIFCACATYEEKPDNEKMAELESMKIKRVAPENKEAPIINHGNHPMVNGDRYIGGFRNEKMEGDGEYFYRNGNRYKEIGRAHV